MKNSIGFEFNQFPEPVGSVVRLPTELGKVLPEVRKVGKFSKRTRKITMENI